MTTNSTVPVAPRIEPHIHDVRGHKVILDADLAIIYGVPTKALNRAVKRNEARFPEDFVFKLTAEELEVLRYQIGTSKISGSGGRRFLPNAFTEHGAIMAANVLNSGRAVEMSVFVVRAFVRLREEYLAHKDLAAKLADLDRAVAGHDIKIRRIMDAIKRMMEPPAAPKRQIGFRTDETPKSKE